MFHLDLEHFSLKYVFFVLFLRKPEVLPPVQIELDTPLAYHIAAISPLYWFQDTS